MSQGRVSTPVVLSAASGMLAVGVIAFATISGGGGGAAGGHADAGPDFVALVIDDRTPERVAESYLDAWRRRAWDQAESIAIGEARERAAEKRATDADIDPVDRVMARDVWARLAGAPLEVEFSQLDRLEDGGLLLRGIASYEFMSEPYRREMSWVVRPEGELWRVESMEAGEVLTEIPEILRGTDL
jgi:hypothetical protein